MSFQRSGEWMNPPPPGTVDDQINLDQTQDTSESKDKDIKRNSQSPKSIEENNTNAPCSRSRSGSRSKDHNSKPSRERRKRSRSRDYRRRRSRSHSGSRKRLSDKRHTYKYRKYSRSRSRSRSRRYRRTYSRSRSPSPHKKRRNSCSRSWSSGSESEKGYRRHIEVLKNQEYTRKLYSKRVDEIEEEEELEPVQENTFKNDGSFLEMFKKMQEQQASDIKTEEPEASVSEPKKPAPLFGKRRGGRVLKTGMVQKVKNPNETKEEPKDAWSVYMKEVRKYKEACCDDDSKTRPLVK